VYLLARDPGPFDWDHHWVRWPDFRCPTSKDDAIAALRTAYERAATARVEIACGGGVGRTGTALAALAVLAGIPPTQAVAWIRSNYQRRAVETPWQRRWILHLDETIDLPKADTHPPIRPRRKRTRTRHRTTSL
jgi:protein-tyrosine phosphatase